MYDNELVKEILSQIYNASEKILKRFEPISNVNDFTDSEAGMEKLDAICMQLIAIGESLKNLDMQLIAIGESLKNLDKITSHTLLPNYPQVDWKKAMAMRDIISHHYFDLNAEAIFDVCETKIKTLSAAVKQIHKDVK